MRTVVVALVLGAALAGTACGDPPNADGTRENPFTELDPGPHGAVAKLHQPIIWGAHAGGSLVRLWIEVLDETTGERHPQETDHFIRQISARIVDGQGSLFERAFLSASQARAVGESSFPADAVSVDLRAECSEHGWWQRIYDVKDLDVAPTGELTRAFSGAVPGDPALAPSHVPFLVARDGELIVEVGDRSDGALHETTPQHYVNRLMILNQDAQTLVDTALGPQGGEPARIVGFEPGIGAVRIYAECNLHGWWETVFIVPE